MPHNQFLINIILAISLLLVSNQAVFCQSQVDPKTVYSLSFLPRKAGGDVVALEKELASAKSRDAVRNIIFKQRLNPCCEVVILETTATKRQVWWFINLGKKTESFSDFTVLRSKSITQATVSRVAAFKEIIKDTLLLLDTLSIAIKLRDAGYSDSAFVLEKTCNGKTSTATAPVGDENSLLFYPAMVSCESGYEQITLVNNFNRERKLATAIITSLNPEQEALIKAIAADCLKRNPNSNAEDFEDFINEVMCTKVGVPQRKALHTWLLRNNLFKLLK